MNKMDFCYNEELRSRISTSGSIEDSCSDEEESQIFNAPQHTERIFEPMGLEFEEKYITLASKLKDVYDQLCSEIEAVSVRDDTTLQSARVDLKNISSSLISRRRQTLKSPSIKLT